MCVDPIGVKRRGRANDSWRRGLLRDDRYLGLHHEPQPRPWTPSRGSSSGTRAVTIFERRLMIGEDFVVSVIAPAGTDRLRDR
jgi:hypothetical protein